MSDPLARSVSKRAQRWLTPASKKWDPPNYATSEQTRDAAVDAIAQHRCDHYTRRPGIAPLCQLIARRMATRDVEIDPNDGVVITGGAAETRYVALRALAARSTVYVVAEQMHRYQTVAELAEVTLVPVDLMAPPADARKGALLLGFPIDTSTEMYVAIAEWACQSDMIVIADEIEQPVLADSTLRPFASLPGMAERTVTLGGFAHEPGLLAWQVAWFAGPKSLLSKVRTLKQAMTICSPAPGQYAALAAMEELEK